MSTVPETILKTRRITRQSAALAKATASASTNASSAKKVEIFKRAERYVADRRKSDRALINARRSARQSGNFYVDPEAKLIFAVRIRGVNHVPPKQRKILELLRLLQLNNGVFLRSNLATLKMLEKVTPYVAFGYPNLKSIRELIYKRGYGKVAGQRLALSDNAVVEKALGQQGIICIEDLINEIVTVGPNFTKANNFLWPFKLNSPKGGMNSKKKHFIQGGDAGNRENMINRLIRQMN